MKQIICGSIVKSAVGLVVALIMLFLPAYVLVAPQIGHAQNVPPVGKPFMVAVPCPACKRMIDTPSGKMPSSCPYCGYSFVQQANPKPTPQTKPKPTPQTIPKLKAINPFGDFLFHDVPIIPDDGKLKTRHLDPNGLAVKAEEWGKEMKQVDDQSRQKQEAQAQEFERDKQDLLKSLGASRATGSALRQLKNVFADDAAWDSPPRGTRGPTVNDANVDPESGDFLTKLQTGKTGNGPYITAEDHQRQKLSGYEGNADGYQTGSSPDVPSAWGTPEQVYEMMSGKKAPMVEDSANYTKNAMAYLAGETAGKLRGAAEEFVVARLGPTGQVLVNIPKAEEEILFPAIMSAAKGELSRAEADKLPLEMAVAIFNDGSASTELVTKIVDKGSVIGGTSEFVKEKAIAAIDSFTQNVVDSAAEAAAKKLGISEVYKKPIEWGTFSADKAPEAWTAIFNPRTDK